MHEALNPIVDDDAAVAACVDWADTSDMLDAHAPGDTCQAASVSTSASKSLARRAVAVEPGQRAPAAPAWSLYEGNPNVWALVGSLDHPEDWPLTKDARSTVIRDVAGYGSP